MLVVNDPESVVCAAASEMRSVAGRIEKYIMAEGLDVILLENERVK